MRRIPTRIADHQGTVHFNDLKGAFIVVSKAAHILAFSNHTPNNYPL